MGMGIVWVIFLTILWLVFLEGLLSADNALVLAMLVRHLPREQQRRALRYGIWGAFTFRFVAVLAARYLADIWYLEVVGGCYLLYLAIDHFVSRGRGDLGDDAVGGRFGKGFWGTVVSVELADIAFSIDSILAAVGMAKDLPPQIGPNGQYFVVVTGGILGILTMRFAAAHFIVLLDRFKGLEAGAYGLIAWIGLKLIVSGLHRGSYIEFEVDHAIFWGGMIAIVVLSLLYRPKKGGKGHSAETSAAINAVTRMAGGDDDANWLPEPSGEDAGKEVEADHPVA
jgi:YkoY family integral membrane protein